LTGKKESQGDLKMRIFIKLFLIISFGSMMVLAGGVKNPHVLIKTELGDIAVEIDEKEAPMTAGNFLKYVDAGLFNDAAFYRVVTMDNQPNNDIKIEVIQGGLGYTEGRKTLPPIEHETTEKSGILHKDGVISMARLQPGTASSEFFICVGDQPELDFGGKRNPDGQGFAAFGKVVAGMDVVKTIHKQPAKAQMLDPRIKIIAIVREDK
jgi:peptidyl-prolyl cis-trans isomerase A (cyclophilin A)